MACIRFSVKSLKWLMGCTYGVAISLLEAAPLTCTPVKTQRLPPLLPVECQAEGPLAVGWTCWCPHREGPAQASQP